MKELCNEQLLKLMYAQDPAEWGARIPDPSKVTWSEMKTLISAPSFIAGRSAIFEQLIQRIGLTRFIQMQANNPLKIFKGGSMLYGDTVQEITSDIVKAEKFGGVTSPDIDQFKVKLNDVQAAYFKINREEFYPVTQPDKRLQQAFLDDTGLQRMLNNILSTLDRSNEVDEFIYAKQAICAYFSNKEFPLLKDQIVSVPNILKPDPTRAEIVKYIETIKKCSKRITFNSRYFNPAKLMTVSRPSDMVLISRFEAGIVNEVQNLSVIFNEQFNNLQIPIIDVDDFGFTEKGKPNLPNVVSILCDRRLIEIILTNKMLTSSWNAQNLYTNFFLHIWQLYKTSPFHNVIFFVGDENPCSEC